KKKQQIFQKNQPLNTKDHNNAKKLEKARIQMESLQNQIFSSNVNENHNTGLVQLHIQIRIQEMNFWNQYLILLKKKWKELSDVIAFGIMIDESTDITITKHLDICVLYVSKEEILKMQFLCLVSLTSSFTSDSASVMLGKMKV
ncbi:891_t:CDS:2, partial [Funneliformis geosporum]